jgi:predicted nucleic acid-binding protein
MYLIDTNIWLERLLEQTRANEVGSFLEHVSSSELYITDFAFHSICVILMRFKKQQALLDFVQDVFIDGAVALASILPEETQSVMNAVNEYNIDFDDAYQLAAADKYDLVIVSFDSDFDRTSRGKKTPAEILATI